MKTPSGALRPAPEGELPPTLLTDNEDALLNEPVYKVVSQANDMLRFAPCSVSPAINPVRGWLLHGAQVSRAPAKRGGQRQRIPGGTCRSE